MMTTKVDTVSLENVFENSPRKAERVLYFHTPFCASRCNYCPFYKYTTAKQSDYAELVVKQMQNHFHLPYFQEAPFDVFFFGGGTPTVLENHQLEAILANLTKYLSFSSDYEFTVESTVRHLDLEKLKLLKKYGVNRISLGIQAFDKETRNLLGRPADFHQIKKLIYQIQEEGFTLNTDLMYGLPNQTLDHVKEQIEIAIDFGVDNLSSYRLQLLGDTPLKKRVESGKVNLPEEKLVEEMQLIAMETAVKGGYVHWNTKNYAKDGKECRYTRTPYGNRDMIPLGSGAGGKIGNFRCFNAPDLASFREKVNEGLFPSMMVKEVTDDLKLAQERLKGILESMQLDLSLFFENTGFSVDPTPLKYLENEGFLETKGEKIRLHTKGILNFQKVYTKISEGIIKI
ncbi:coproporphyrinogen-III oxidase family protein [Sediminitomix flava]|uniref:Anaerobic coproporphyrinogen III oxidase n=1 Tax=Sediminitomix flava TaxID=379075 RepID=A0A315ZGL6_SEDFL|nr:coproporphyrinogen-III oxidase family protein [Sediminitomix flava]PWJ44303.1 anaerobic coproporphyrinogen III oxidase [Sediminitomix flava]